MRFLTGWYFSLAPAPMRRPSVAGQASKFGADDASMMARFDASQHFDIDIVTVHALPE